MHWMGVLIWLNVELACFFWLSWESWNYFIQGIFVAFLRALFLTRRLRFRCFPRVFFVSLNRMVEPSCSLALTGKRRVWVITIVHLSFFWFSVSWSLPLCWRTIFLQVLKVGANVVMKKHRFFIHHDWRSSGRKLLGIGVEFGGTGTFGFEVFALFLWAISLRASLFKACSYSFRNLAIFFFFFIFYLQMILSIILILVYLNGIFIFLGDKHEGLWLFLAICSLMMDLYFSIPSWFKFAGRRRVKFPNDTVLQLSKIMSILFGLLLEAWFSLELKSEIFWPV